jgi:hypothetical protein
LKPEIRSVVRRSGNRTARLFFAEELTPAEQKLPLDALQSMDTWMERANPYVVCVNINPTADYTAVCARLAELESAGVLEYETCEERMPGSFDDVPGADDDYDGDGEGDEI